MNKSKNNDMNTKEIIKSMYYINKGYPQSAKQIIFEAGLYQDLLKITNHINI